MSKLQIIIFIGQIEAHDNEFKMVVHARFRYRLSLNLISAERVSRKTIDRGDELTMNSLGPSATSCERVLSGIGVSKSKNERTGKRSTNGLGRPTGKLGQISYGFLIS